MIGYKEWSLVCEALGAGVQCLLLRKGGIAEGQGGFAFKYPRFYLFPTLFHQQEEQVLWSPLHEEVRSAEGSWLIRYEAELVAATVLTDWGKVQALSPFHIWKESVLKERFEYNGNHQIQAALVRVRKLAGIVHVADSKELRGCRSWVEYPEGSQALSEESVPVLTDSIFNGIRSRVEELWKI